MIGEIAVGGGHDGVEQLGMVASRDDDLLALLPAQEAGTAEAADGLQMVADLSFEMMLVVIGGAHPRQIRAIICSPFADPACCTTP